MQTLLRSTLALTALAALAAVPSGALAAGSGLAYDSVMKFQTSQDGTQAAPGTFGPDFAAASAPAPSHGGGMFGRMMAGMQNMGAMFEHGTAERHYYGTTKFRTDNLALGTGDITDCAARTLTHLDLNAKTYHVTSLDEPQAPPHPGHDNAAPGPAATDDGTKIAIDLTTKALGPLTVEGVATNGYSMNMKMTVTKADGESSTSNQTITAYYSNMAEPEGSCPAAHMPMAMGGMGAMGGGGMRGGAAMAQMMLAMQAINGHGDSRFKVTTSGPPLPSGKLAMWQMMSMTGGDGSRGGFGIVTERGNVHPVSDGDPAFGVPDGFTKV